MYARHVAIHFDPDVLDPTRFRGLRFASPASPVGAFDGVAHGSMRIPEVARLIQDVAKVADAVRLGVTEPVPWDAIALKAMLIQLPLLAGTQGRAA
ncbi:hypothetical protein [Burkholderia catarinensis]|uniref:hypothetical protein n=1 Tax=Burkholderia catarinensis TaxID=1108140 RepID=UPI0009142103|nr:hypothetical protein [Burkholderia catarinensis]